jgi:hypothetical protein
MQGSRCEHGSRTAARFCEARATPVAYARTGDPPGGARTGPESPCAGAVGTPWAGEGA